MRMGTARRSGWSVHRGFTLVELMICVAVMGVLASVAVPTFVKFQCRSKQSEAKTMLRGILTAQVAYGSEYSSGFVTMDQLTSFGGLDARSVSAARYYSFMSGTTVVGAETEHFVLAQDTKNHICGASDDAWLAVLSQQSVGVLQDACGSCVMCACARGHAGAAPGAGLLVLLVRHARWRQRVSPRR